MRSVRGVRPALAALALLVILLLSACFGSETFTLEVLSISPEPDAEDVPIDAVLSVQLSGDVDELTVTDESVQLFHGETLVETELAVDGDTVTVTPAALLRYGTEYTLVVAGTVADAEGNTLSGEATGSFTTRYLTITTRAGGQPLSGVRIELDGSFAGTTNSAGQLTLSRAAGSATFAAEKRLFVPVGPVSVGFNANSYEFGVELDPYIYVPNQQLRQAGEIIRMESINSDRANYDVITSVPLAAGTYDFQAPMGIYADYDNGAIYVLDAPNRNSSNILVKMTNLPPADASEATVVNLSGQNGSVSGSQQLALENDDSIVLVDFRFNPQDLNYGQGRLVRIPSDLDFTQATFSATWNDAFMYGITQLPGGEFLTVGGDLQSQMPSTVDALLFDALDDATPATFGSLVFGSGTDEMRVPTRVLLSRDGSHVFVSDTGDSVVNQTSERNDRIVRMAVDGSGFTSYGTPFAGPGHFVNPVLLGLLPDGRLYVMDVGNDRLVSFDPAVFDGGAEDWAESDPTATFTFDYWYVRN